MSKAANPLGLVVRVSRVGKREGERFQSPDDQVKIGTAHAQGQGYQVRVFDQDAKGGGVSGATPFEQRPGLGEAIRLVEDGKLGGIVVAAQDRLVREDAENGVTLRSFQKRIRDADAVLLVADSPQAEVVDPDADELEGNEEWGIAGRTLADSIYRREMRKRWRRARANAIERGAYVGPTPAGYDREENGHLVPGEHAAVIRAAFTLRADGGSWSRVASVLTEAGVPTSKGASRWSLKGAAKLISNEAYLGVARSGPYRNEDAHEPLVEKWLFDRANESRAVTRQRSTDDGWETERPQPALLSGLLLCGGCGHRLVRDTVTRHRPTADDVLATVQYEYYRCRNVGACIDRAGISGLRAEAFVLEQVRERAKLRIGETVNQEAGSLRTKRDELRVKLTAIAEDVDIDLDLAKARTAKLKERLAEVETALVDFDAEAASIEGLRDLPFDEFWTKADQDARRSLIREVVGPITVAPGRGSAQERMAA